MSQRLDPRSDPHGRSIELLWLDPRRLTRIRKKVAWRSLVDDALRSSTDKPGTPSLPNQSVPPEDRRDLRLILARAEATDAEGVATALTEGVRDDGKFAPPLSLVAGELRFPFDEVESLKATMTTATPFMGGDEPLKTAVDAAREFLAIPHLSPAPAVVEVLTGRIREAFAKTKRAVPADYLETQTERALLEQRHYQRRTFQGGRHLRALLHPSGDKGAMLVYLPETLSDKLPLFQRFGARLIVEVHLSVDQYEAYPYALSVLALAREIPEAPAARRG